MGQAASAVTAEQLRAVESASGTTLEVCVLPCAVLLAGLLVQVIHVIDLARHQMLCYACHVSSAMGFASLCTPDKIVITTTRYNWPLLSYSHAHPAFYPHAESFPLCSAALPLLLMQIMIPAVYFV